MIVIIPHVNLQYLISERNNSTHFLFYQLIYFITIIILMGKLHNSHVMLNNCTEVCNSDGVKISEWNIIKWQLS